MKNLHGISIVAASAALVACSENPTQPENLTLKATHLTVLTPGGNNLLASKIHPLRQTRGGRTSPGSWQSEKNTEVFAQTVSDGAQA